MTRLTRWSILSLVHSWLTSCQLFIIAHASYWLYNLMSINLLKKSFFFILLPVLYAIVAVFLSLVIQWSMLSQFVYHHSFYWSVFILFFFLLLVYFYLLLIVSVVWPIESQLNALIWALSLANLWPLFLYIYSCVCVCVCQIEWWWINVLLFTIDIIYRYTWTQYDTNTLHSLHTILPLLVWLVDDCAKQLPHYISLFVC